MCLGFGQNVFDAAHIQKAPPVVLLGFVQAEGLGELGKVFAGVVEIYDVDGPGKMGRGDGFIVAGAVGEDDYLLGAHATPANGFLINAHAKERARFDGSDIGGGVGIAHRAAFLVGAGLGEYATEFDLAGFGVAICGLALGGGQLALAHGDSGAIETDIKLGDGGGRCGDLVCWRFTRFLRLGFLFTDPVLDGASDIFGNALDLFGGDIESGVDAEVFAGIGEGGATAGPGHHAAHAGRKRCALDAEGLVERDVR